MVVEPTGPAWLPIAVFFTRRGHLVHRVSSAKAADLRRFLCRHTKTNGIDADTLARLPLFDPAGLQPRVLPGAEQAALDRRVRATDRLTQAGADHNRRIKALVRQLLPMSPLTGDLGVADLAVLEHYADPNALLRLGSKRLTTLIGKASHSHQGSDRAQQWATPPTPRWPSTPATPRRRSPIWPLRSPPRSGCCAPCKPSSSLMPSTTVPATGRSTRPGWHAVCPVSPTSAAPPGRRDR